MTNERAFHDFARDDDLPDTCRICGQSDRSPIHTDRRYEPPRFHDYEPHDTAHPALEIDRNCRTCGRPPGDHAHR